MSTAPFGIIISGRPVDATPQVVTEAQYAFRIPPAPAFSHIVVFLLPGITLPAGSAASVYVQIPPSQDFKLLGAIGPGKESAIFKISGLKASGNADQNAMLDDPTAQAGGAAVPGGDIVVGVSIEPEAQVATQLATLQNGGQPSHSQPSSALVRLGDGQDGRASTKVLAQRIIGNAFNFLASFGSDTVPLKAFQDWWQKFEKKIELDPSFLEREGAT
ncbi:Putative OPI10 family protein [Septoria linicola]|uniref:OPI10 family protein n=1 Tax=Septoria linicola TaxID=215465 RepID=A0A9Q9ENY6_9PEZI|nr:putative OPI10 family protein [Septoria linicola]USW57122.1 Putative OPI10 family protein [Septoria linicola]